MAFIKNSTCKLITEEIPIHSKWVNTPCMVHTSAIKSSKENTQTDNNERYHVNHLGWDHIGYLFSIEQDGRIFYSEKTGYKQYHCKGQNNKSFGICIIGDGSMQRATKEQIYSLKKIFKAYNSKEIRLHRDFSKKSCPGDALLKSLEEHFSHLIKRY